MKLIDRILPEYMDIIEEKKSEYPTLTKDIMETLNGYMFITEIPLGRAIVLCDMLCISVNEIFNVFKPI
jgi:hypothetical protein